jgi:hypothetical protein
MNNSTDELPENIKRRLNLFKMFYPLERKLERRWAKVFHSPFEEITEKFKEKSSEENYKQEVVKENLILWQDTDDKDNTCMFYFIRDPMDFKSFQNLYWYIDEHKPLLTYAIVHQRKDGEGVYDIFRCSKFSYLEHCNRVKVPGKK